MVDTGELEQFLNDKSAKKGDICEIMSEGTLEVKEDVNTKRKYKVLNLPVKLNSNIELIWSPAKLATAALQKLYNKETKNWVGKKFQIDLVKMLVKGEMREIVFPIPLEAKKV